MRGQRKEIIACGRGERERKTLLLYTPARQSVLLFFCLFIDQSITQHVYSSVYISAFPYTYLNLSFHLSISIPVFPSMSTCPSQSVYLSIYLHPGGAMEALKQVDKVEHGEEGDRYVQVTVLAGTQFPRHGDGEGVEVQEHLSHLGEVGQVRTRGLGEDS